jgi:hypothetical protein
VIGLALTAVIFMFVGPWRSLAPLRCIRNTVRKKAKTLADVVKWRIGRALAPA